MRIHRLPLLAAAALAVGSAQIAVAASAPQQHVRGTISAVSPTKLTIATASGSVDVPVGAKTRVAGVVPATVADITAGTFIGTANVADGTAAARALEVVVFPKAMAGTGEGDYPWDLPAGKHGSMMTNGTVGARHSGSMMTNATVTAVTAGAAKTVTLQYKGGSKVVSIPADAPIVRIVPGTRSLFTTGAHVVAFPAAGSAAAAAVIVGEQGAVPPM